MLNYFTIMQSQFWLALAQHGCRMSNISFDRMARQALLDVVPPAGAVSLTLAQHDRLLLVVDRETEAMSFGLFTTALRIDFSQIAGLCALLCAKPTLGAAFEYLAANIGLAHPGYRAWLEHHPDGRCTIAFDITQVAPAARQCHEQILFGALINLVQQFPVNDGACLHKAIVSLAMLRRCPSLTALNLPLEVSERHCGLQFDSAILARRSAHHSSGMEHTLQQVFEATLAHDRVIASHANQVVDLLLARIEADQPIGLGDIAACMGLRSRTLQHYLGLEQVSFNYLRGHVQMHVACRLISEGCSTDEIALRLGYSSRSAFHHAFTRNTGLRPTQVRRGQIPQRMGAAPPPSAL